MQIPELKMPEHGYTKEGHPGNAGQYDVNKYPAKENSPLKGKHLIFLGSSVTLGFASMNQSFADDLEHLDGIDDVHAIFLDAAGHGSPQALFQVEG